MTTETDVIDEVQRRLDTFHSPSFDREIVEQLLALARRTAASAEPAVAVAQWQRYGNLIKRAWINIEPDEVEEWRRDGYPVRALYAAPLLSPVVSEAMVRALAEVLLGRVNAPEQEIWRASRDGLEAALSPAPAGEVGWRTVVEHLARQREWSERTFGPGNRTQGVLDHIRKELDEIEADPLDIAEWVDVIILAFDGAWRAGWEPEAIVAAWRAKQAKNEARQWPDWRTAAPDKAIEHIRDPLPASPTGGDKP